MVYTDQTWFCDACGKKFTVTPYQSSWKYITETIDGEVTEEEYCAANFK